MEVTGLITNMYTKEVDIKRGPRAGSVGYVHYIQVDTDTVNVGFKNPYEMGEVVTLNVEESYGELRVAKGPSTGASGSVSMDKTSAVANAGPRKAAFPVPLEANGTSICRQSSLNRAVEAINDMQVHDIIDFDSQEQYEKAVLELAYKFTDFVTGQREVKAAAGIASKAGSRD